MAEVLGRVFWLALLVVLSMTFGAMLKPDPPPQPTPATPDMETVR